MKSSTLHIRPSAGRSLLLASGLLSLSLLAVSCDDSLSTAGGLERTPVKVSLHFPEEVTGSKIINPSYRFTNLSSGITTLFQSPEEIDLIPGIYDFEYSATIEMEDGRKLTLKGVKKSIIVDDKELSFDVNTFCSLESDDLIISEVFFTGTLHSSGNQYYGDDYVKLYNNTDHVIYADGLTLFETKFLTTEKREYTPDIMDSAVTVQALYTIPGTGKEHPVQPGEYLLLADTGIDHRVANPNSFDLSGADFEWYDISTKPNNLDIDGPVPNLDKWYCYTLSFWVLHNRGFKAYGIARIPVDKEKYLKDYYYTYDYLLETVAGTFPMSASAYRLPNEWVVDIVNCSVEAKYAWNLCAPSLDMGWTHCGTIDHDKSRYFHSIRRKLLYLNDDGNPVFKDTNNSSEDFNPMCIPSEIELQGTAINAEGTRCETLTYDGVVPIP